MVLRLLMAGMGDVGVLVQNTSAWRMEHVKIAMGYWRVVLGRNMATVGGGGGRARDMGINLR